MSKRKQIVLFLFATAKGDFMQVIKAIYDGVNFMPMQPVPVKGKYEVFITFVEPIDHVADYNLRYLRQPDTTKTPVLGRLNGLIKIPDDFDEPLEEMREYMF